jgi:hypothetical protein
MFYRNTWIPAAFFLVLWILLFEPWLSIRSIEPGLYDLLFGSLLAVLYLAMAISWMQFLLCWHRFKRYLEWLERQPVRNAFSRLRKEVSWVPLVTKPGEHPLFISTRASDCLTAIVQFENLACADDQAELKTLKEKLKPQHEKIRVLIKELDLQLSKGLKLDSNVYGQLQECLAIAAKSIQSSLEKSHWQRGDSDSLRRETELRPSRKPIDSTDRLIVLKEEFIALRYLIYMRYVFRQLRNLLGFIIAGFIISVISLNTYPFEGHRLIGFGSIVIFLALGLGVGFVFAEMDRDAILSRLTETKANEVGRTFFLRLAQYGSLPLLTVLASQFPSIHRFLFSWVRPVIEALH